MKDYEDELEDFEEEELEGFEEEDEEYGDYKNVYDDDDYEDYSSDYEEVVKNDLCKRSPACLLRL